ncbi:MAG: diguanylate cyclase, partial [Terriglobia bacterium]
MGTAKTRGPTRPSSNGNDPAAGEFGVGKVLDSEKLTTLLFDSITDFITVQDTDFNILKINKVVGEVYGTDVVGRKCYEAYQGRRSVCPGCAVENALATGEPAFSSEQKGKPGNYAEIWAFPIRDEQGNIVAVAEHGRDISERKKTEVELAELNGKLEKTNRKLEVANKRLKQLVVVDSHTGLFNHRYLEGALKTKFQKARKKKNRLSLIMFDLDYFKSINDVYGHPFGDVVLTQVSELLKNGIRKYDTLARFGGEEFALLVPEANRTNAESLAKGLLESVARERFGTAEHGVHIKMSAGVVSYPEDAAVDGSELLSKADKALRAAKERGGNCVSGPSDSVPEESGGNDSGDPAHVRRLKQRIGNLSKRSNQYMTEAMFAFVKTLELKDPYAGDHADQTVTYAVETAKILGLTAPEIESIRKAAMLRDLGKVSLSDSIL